MLKNTLRIGWWNTRLSPPRGNKLQGSDRQLAFRTINDLLNSGLDILGLCEVDDSDITEIITPLNNTFIARRFAVTDVGRKFHMCLISRRDTVIVHASSAFTKSEARRTFRIAVWASCAVEDLAFELYFVHWPSRLYAQQEGFERSFFGYALREDIDQKIQAGRANIIVAGDFNDEPYNTSMTYRVLSTRDPTIARLKPDYLYNPFWKRMAPTIGHTPNSTNEEFFGSYYHNGNALEKWHSLDQLLVSGTFLGPLTWHLEESGTDVWRPTELLERVASSGSLIDHLPLIGKFVRY